MLRLTDEMVTSQGRFRTFLFDKQNICQLRHQVDVIVFSQGVVVPEIASRFTHWELRQARRLQIAGTPHHSADNKDYTDYTGLQGAAVLLLLLLHRMTGSIYTIPTGQICREFAMLWETHCVSCVNMHLMCNLHYFMCNLHYSMCITRPLKVHFATRSAHSQGSHRCDIVRMRRSVDQSWTWSHPRWHIVPCHWQFWREKLTCVASQLWENVTCFNHNCDKI